jgi:peptidyl-prolyl cis-trans isomerase SurA
MWKTIFTKPLCPTIQSVMRKSSIIIVLICALAHSISAQQVVEGVIAVIGDKVILKSAVETQYLQLRQQSTNFSEDTKCQIINELILQKLLSHHAEVDSLEVTEDEVNSTINQRLDYFVSELGSEQKVENYFDKSINEIRNEFASLIKEQMLAQRMEGKVISDISITPQDVHLFYNRIPKDSLPVFEEEIQLSQLIVFPKVDEKERQRITKKLNEFKQRIQDGEDFSFIASLYSDDGSASLGGDLGFVKKGKFVPEFESAAFRLQEGELSNIVETKFGFHLIQMVKRRGEQFNVRHILIKPKISAQSIAVAKSKLDSIIGLMEKDTLSFEQLALRYSEDESKNNGGVIVNPLTGSSSFGLKELSVDISSTIDGLAQGDHSLPTVFSTLDGRTACRVIHIDKVIEEHEANLKDDYDRIFNVALKEKQSEALQSWKQQKLKETFIDIKDDYNCN